MKRTKWMLMMTSMLLSGLAVAQLQGDAKIVAQVPFEFMVANRFVPAGRCEIRSFAKNGGAQTIRLDGTRVALFARASLTETKKAADNYALVFKRYGNQYFLSGIKLPGSHVTYRLPESKAEAELRAQNLPGGEEVLLASLK